MSSQIPLSCADITGREISAASDALRAEQLVFGPWTKRFEKAVASHAGSTFGVATHSSHSAMHVVLESLGIQQGDEVITPAFAFPSAAATLLRMGVTPIFADCDARTLNMDCKDVSAKLTDKTKAIIATHTFGNPEGIEAIARVAQEQEITLIEDAGQAIASKINGRKVGSFGRAAVFAFHSSTQLTSVQGGVITTDDNMLAEKCKAKRNHGFVCDPSHATDELHHVRTDELMQSMGHGYRISEVHAAVGTVQMQRLDEIMARRDQLAKWYIQKLCGVAEIMCPTIAPKVEMSWEGFVVRVNDNYSRDDRDEIIRGLHRHEIGAADYYQSIPSLPLFEKACNAADTCPVANSISKRVLALPFYTSMTEREVDIVCQTLELMLTRGSFTDR